MTGTQKQPLRYVTGVHCPECAVMIDADSMNTKEDVALCRHCGKLSNLWELSTCRRSIEELLKRPPSGCSLEATDQVFVATVSLRSIDKFILWSSTALFHNGITSILMTGPIGGLYSNLIGDLPTWYPGVKMGRMQLNGQPMGLDDVLLLSLILIPFSVIGIVMAGAALMYLYGKIRVVIDEFDSYVTTGVGFIQWKRRFSPRHVQTVEIGKTPWQSNVGEDRLIELKANPVLKFGSKLNADQRAWLRAVLRIALRPDLYKRQASSIPELTWLTRGAE
jgi:hypothetical protein